VGNHDQLGLDKWMLELMAEELLRQCEFALMAYDDLQEALAQLDVLRPRSRGRTIPPPQPEGEPQEAYYKRLLNEDEKSRQHQRNIHIRIWLSLQALLGAIGNVSKLLWPQRAKSSTRGRALREMLEVNQASPLKNRQLRNDFEHVDERFEEWIAKPSRFGILIDTLGPPRPVGILEETDSFRQLDPKTMVAYFWTQPFELPVAMSEVSRLARLSAKRTRR
jgi:hypothetical protein